MAQGADEVFGMVPCAEGNDTFAGNGLAACRAHGAAALVEIGDAHRLTIRLEEVPVGEGFLAVLHAIRG